MKQISIIHQSAENHQGQKLLNAPRNFDRLPESFLVRNGDSKEAKVHNVTQWSFVDVA